jgi:hypothetical protein
VKQHTKSEQARLLVEIDEFLFSDIDFYNGNKFSKIIAQSIFQLPIAAHLSK